ncbi:MAG: cache domain-containing protein, partial [Rhodospirillales bacterium]
MKFKLSLFHVFLLLALIALIGVATLSGISATTMRDTMLHDRQDKVKQIILSVNAIVRHELAKQKSNEQTPEAARERILSAIQSVRFDGDNYIFAITYDFCTLAHVDPTKMGKCKKLPRREVFNELARNGGGFSRYKGPKPGFQGDTFDKVSYIHPVPEMNMYIGTGAYFDDINDVYQKRLLQLGGIGLAIITVIVAFGALVGRSVSKALRTLSSRMSELAEGKLDVVLDITSFVREVDEMIGSVK